jgi:DNA-binding CsgD family transcriptional regulator
VRRTAGDLHLVGRDEEFAFLRRTPAGHCNSVIGGAAGVGKSRLLAEQLRWAGEAGVTVVHVRATVSTASIPFGAFARWVPPGVTGGSDRLEILRAIAEAVAPPGRATIVGVDDAHLLDEGSAALCLELAQRPDAGVSVAVRTGEPAPDAVTALWKDGLAERIDLQPLSEPETHRLVHAALGGAVSEELRVQVWRLSEGLPLYALEVVAAGLERGVIRVEGGAWDWDGELPGSDRLRSLILGRVEHVDAAGRRTLEQLALGEPLALEVLSQLAHSSTIAALEASGHIVVTAGPDTVTARLSHPLYAEVLRRELPLLARRRASAELVEATRRAGFEPGELLRVAQWHADSDQDPDVNLLLTAIERAFALDDWALVDRLVRASEAAGAGVHATLMSAMSFATLGRWDEAETRLASIDPEMLDDDLALRWATIRAWIDLFHHGDSGAAKAALGALAVRSGPTAAGAAAEAALLALFTADVAEMQAQIELVRSTADGGERPALLADVIDAMRLTFIGDHTLARPVIDAAIDSAVSRLDADAIVPAVLSLAHLYGRVLDGDLDGAADFAANIHARTDGRLPSMRALWLTYVAYAELFRGDLARALALARQANAGPDERDLLARRLWTAGAVATSAAQLGDLETADAAIAWAQGRWPAARTFHPQINLAAAWLADARGHASRAHTLVEEVISEARPGRLVLIELFALHDLVRLGAPERATARLAEIAAAMNSPYATTVADHAIAATNSDGPGLDSTAGRFAQMGARLHAAEAYAQAAIAHRGQGRRGSELTSIAAAHRLRLACPGALTAPLRSLDYTPVLHDLTTREREVVELAARTLTNREIAATLYISVRTVTTHLQRAYSKLGVNDRTQLAALVISERDDTVTTTPAD